MPRRRRRHLLFFCTQSTLTRQCGCNQSEAGRSNKGARRAPYGIKIGAAPTAPPRSSAFSTAIRVSRSLKYRSILRTAPFWLALLALLVMALKTSPNNQIYHGADKLYHWFGFATLTFTAHLAYPRIKLSSLLIWILIGATSIELLQALSPTRTASLADMTVNIIGVLTGLGATQLVPKKYTSDPPAGRRRKRRSHSRSQSGLEERPR